LTVKGTDFRIGMTSSSEMSPTFWEEHLPPLLLRMKETYLNWKLIKFGDVVDVSEEHWPPLLLRMKGKYS
jgi:hypothetical protein